MAEILQIDQKLRSLMQIRKSNGLSTEPCGTQKVIR